MDLSCFPKFLFEKPRWDEPFVARAARPKRKARQRCWGPFLAEETAGLERLEFSRAGVRIGI